MTTVTLPIQRRRACTWRMASRIRVAHAEQSKDSQEKTMKAIITVQDGDVRVTFTPESEIERLSLMELGDDVSVSRSHQSIVLKPRRATNVRKITDRLGEAEGS
jgi:hypothetical protein